MKSPNHMHLVLARKQTIRPRCMPRRLTWPEMTIRFSLWIANKISSPWSSHRLDSVKCHHWGASAWITGKSIGWASGITRTISRCVVRKRCSSSSKRRRRRHRLKLRQFRCLIKIWKAPHHTNRCKKAMLCRKEGSYLHCMRKIKMSRYGERRAKDRRLQGPIKIMRLIWKRKSN